MSEPRNDSFDADHFRRHQGDDWVESSGATEKPVSQDDRSAEAPERKAAEPALLRLATTAASYFRTRLELAALDWEFERERLLAAVGQAIGVAMAAMLGLAFAATAIVLLAPDHWRPWVAGALGLGFGLAGWVMYRKLVVSAAQAAFSNLRSELESDRIALREIIDLFKQGSGAADPKGDEPASDSDKRGRRS